MVPWSIVQHQKLLALLAISFLVAGRVSAIFGRSSWKNFHVKVVTGGRDSLIFLSCSLFVFVFFFFFSPLFYAFASCESFTLFARFCVDFLQLCYFKIFALFNFIFVSDTFPTFLLSDKQTFFSPAIFVYFRILDVKCKKWTKIDLALQGNSEMAYRILHSLIY